MRDIMIDIETLGTKPGSVIASIGAVAFDATTGEMGDTFYIKIDVADAESEGLSIDANTVAWWMQQSDEARASTFTGEDIVGLAMALEELLEYVKRQNADRVWGNGPSFDLVQLEAAYSALGGNAPWSFRAHRDLRTLRDLTGVDIPNIGTAHNALDDAIAQAHAVIEAYKVLGLTSTLPA